MSSSNGVSTDALGNSGTANGLATGYNNGAAATGSILTPTLNRMVTAPAGYGAQTVNNMTTAATQGAGGGAAATVGGALQRAAATNNAGGAAPVTSQAGRDASVQLSDAALGIQNQDAQLKEQQREQGIQGLTGMYSTDVGAGENAIGLSNQSLNVADQGKAQALAPWLAYMNGAQKAAGNSAGAGG